MFGLRRALRQPAPPGGASSPAMASPGRHPCGRPNPRGGAIGRRRSHACPHRPPSHNAGSPRWTPGRKLGDPRNGQKRHRQRRTYPPGDHPERIYPAGGRASQKASVTVRRQIARGTWRQAEATRHRTLANLVRDLEDRCQTRSMPPAYPHQLPTRRNPRIVRAPPHLRPRHIAATQASRETPCPARPTTGPTWSPGEVRSPGNHTRHARTRSRQGNVSRRAQPRRRLFRCLHGVLQEYPPHGPNTGCPARPSGATRCPYRGHTPHGVPPGTPPARLHRPGDKN